MSESVSNLSSSQSMRMTVSRLQRELVEVRTQASTGKIADRGLVLGSRASLSVDLNEQVKRIETIRSMNANVGARVDATQNVLDSMRGLIESVMEQFLQAKSAGGDFTLVQKTASDALATINDKLNASFNGQYLFAGVNTDIRPMATDPTDPSSPGLNAMNAAFLAHFGMNQSDPAVAAISASDVSNYINGPFAALFEDSSWRANFSGASEKVIRSRVSMSEVVDSSVSADAGPFRDVTRALSIISASAIDRMGSQAAGAALDLALKALGEGQQGVTAMQSSLGAVQKRVEDATERLTIQSQSLAKTLGSIEDIDPYEVSVRLNTLSTQLDTAYALTSRMQNLSLLKYL